MKDVDLVKSGLDDARFVDGMGTARIRAKKPGALAVHPRTFARSRETLDAIDCQSRCAISGSFVSC